MISLLSPTLGLIRTCLLFSLLLPSVTLRAFPEEDLVEEAAKVFSKHCYFCHNQVDGKGGLSLHTYNSLMKGGKHGPPVIPGDSNRSRMVLMMEGILEPMMPQGGFLLDQEIEVIRGWIDSGAPRWKGDLSRMAIADLPAITPKTAVQTEIASLAFRPDGQLLAAGTYQEVRLVDVESGEIAQRLGGHAETVRALSFSPDGSLLAAAGGMPARYGEIKIWELEKGQLLRTLEGHSDCIYSVAFSPDGRLLATSSYDRLVKIWDFEQGLEIRTIKGHIDAVYSLAFQQQRRLVSVSADRTVKVWDVNTGEQLFKPMSEPSGELYALALHPDGELVAAAGADKMIRTWGLTGHGGKLLRSAFAHDSPILCLAFALDGKTLISAGVDRQVKFWNVDTLQEYRVLEQQPDWVLALAVSPNGRTLAVGRYDGAVDFHRVE